MSNPRADDGPQARLDMLGGSQSAAIGTVDTRVVGGNMYSTTYSYTSNVFTAPPSDGASGSTGDTGVLPSGAISFYWNAMELRTLVQRILRPFRIISQDPGAKDSFLLSNMGEDSDPPLPMKTPGEAYVSAMLHAGKGLPCWKPRPRRPTRDGVGVVIGDVGIFSIEGGFRKIFNVWDDEEFIRNSPSASSYDIPYHTLSKPSPFTEPNELVQGESVVRGAWSETVYESDNQTIARFEFHHLEPHKQGAVLAMTSAGRLEELDESDRMDLREFISRHAGLIYVYANSIRPIDNHEALYIISGCIKSETWGLAAFTDPVMHPLHVPRLVRMTGPHADDSGSRLPAQPTFAWRSLGTFDAFVGRSSVDGSQDQTLFLRGFKLDFSEPFRAQEKRKGTPFSKGHDPSGSKDGSFQSPDSNRSRPGGERPGGSSSGEHPNSSLGEPQGGGGGPSDSVEKNSDISISSFPDDSSQESFHPCDTINRFLLTKTGLNFSLSHDDDWTYLVGKCTVTEPSSEEQRASVSTTLRNMNESEVSQLCGISVRHGVASLSFDEMAAGSSAAGTTVLTVRSDETGSTRRVEDPQIHLLGAKTSTMVPDEGAENVTSGARSPLGRTHYKSGRDFGVEELEGPSQTMVQPPTQFATYFDPLFTVNEADEDLFTQAQDQKKVKEDEGYRRPTEKEKSAGSKTMNETFIFVRPPPSKSNHPLNVQVQLVPPRAPQMNYNRTYASSAETLVSAYDASSTASTLVTEREGPERGSRRRIIPLYNLQAHNVLTNMITDAGTDAKVTKFQKRGMELVDLAVFEPVEVWGEGSESGKQEAKGRATWVTVDSTGSVVLTPPNATKQDIPPPESSRTITPSANTLPGLPQPQLQTSPQPHLRKVLSPTLLSSRRSTVGKPPPLTGSSNIAVPQPPKRFSAMRRWFSTNKGTRPHDAEEMGQTTQASTGSGVAMEPSGVVQTPLGQDSVDIDDAMRAASSAVGSPSPVQESMLQLQLRPPILGTQARYILAFHPQTEEEATAVNLGLEIIGEDGDSDGLRDGKSPTAVKRTTTSTGRESMALKAGSALLEGDSIASGTSSTTLVGPSSGDFVAQDQANENERAEVYVWLAVKWLKKRSVPPRGDYRPPNLALGPRVGGEFDVRFEWVRARTKGRAKGPVVGKGVQAAEAGHVLDYGGGDDDDDNHPEDSETPWVCTLRVRKIGVAQAPSYSYASWGNMATQTSPAITREPGTMGLGEAGGSEEEKGEKEATLRLKVGVLSPTPHHPKVVAMLKIPFPLPDVEVERMTLVKREGLVGQPGAKRGDHNESYYGLTLTAEEIKDIVCSTGLWLVVREAIGGVGKGARKGDGWKIRG